VLNLALQTESWGAKRPLVGSKEGVTESANIWSLFEVEDVSGSVMLSSGARDGTDSDIWKIWLEFQFLYDEYSSK
jgi:hypothetical protein